MMIRSLFLPRLLESTRQSLSGEMEMGNFKPVTKALKGLKKVL